MGKKKESHTNTSMVEPSTTIDHKTFPKLNKRMILTVLIALSLFIVIASGYMFYDYQRNQNKIANPQQEVKKTTDELVQKVGRLIELPQKETPTIATVSDISKLKSQPFFANAENGDKVLIYTQTKKAILYRPSKNILINVAPLNISESASTNGNRETNIKSSPVQISIYNGTSVAGLAGTYEKQLLKLLPNAVVKQKSNAQRKDYQGIQIIDLKGDKKEIVTTLAKILSAQVITLPEGEATPEGDFLIIVGK
jgi:hypothetical protein